MARRRRFLGLVLSVLLLSGCGVNETERLVGLFDGDVQLGVDRVVEGFKMGYSYVYSKSGERICISELQFEVLDDLNEHDKYVYARLNRFFDKLVFWGNGTDMSILRGTWGGFGAGDYEVLGECNFSSCDSVVLGLKKVLDDSGAETDLGMYFSDIAKSLCGGLTGGVSIVLRGTDSAEVEETEDGRVFQVGYSDDGVSYTVRFKVMDDEVGIADIFYG